MTILRGRRASGHAVSVTLGGSGGTNPTPPSLTGISFSQPQAIPATLNDGNANQFIIATFAPVGGTGPYLYALSPAGFATLSTGKARGGTDRGCIAVPANSNTSGAVTLQITDATGAVATRAVTIDTTGNAKAIIASALRTFPANYNPYNLGVPIGLWTGSAIDTSVTPTITDPSGYFNFSYGAVGLNSVNNFPPVGSYTVTVSATGYSPLSLVITIVAATAGTPYFVQTLSPVSTSVLAGTVIGKIIATTPNNSFVPTITDATGTLGINGTNVVIAQQPSSAGPISFTTAVNDGGVTTTGSASLTVVQGTTLNPSAMMISGLTTAFNNDTFNNVLGTIPTPAGITGTPMWTLVSQTGFNPLALSTSDGTSPARYQIDQSGHLIAPAILSAGIATVNSGTLTLPSATDTLSVSCTDGINTCTRSDINVVVSWAPRTTIYVGRGMAAAHPGAGYEHLVDFRKAIATSDYAPHSGTYDVQIAADADADYYTNDTGTPTQDYSARFPWPGPIIFRGIAGNGHAQPRLGGPSANNVAGGSDMRGKGFFTCGQGDSVLFNLEISGCHDAISDGSHGVDAITKDGLTYGNCTALNCYLHDNDNNYKTGVCHGIAALDSNLIENGGTSYVGSGATHNVYVGEMSLLIFRNNVSRRSTNGYLLKCRAMVSQIYANRFLDGLSGSASACIDLPFAGQADVHNNVIEKGAMALGPDTIRYAEEGIVWSTNTLNVHDNTLSVLTLAGAHYSPESVIGFFGGANTKGVLATATLANNAIYLAAGANPVNLDNGSSSAAVTISGTTTLAAPPAIDATRPDLGGAMPAAGPLYRHQSYGQDTFRNFDGAYQYQDRDQVQVSHTAAAGTMLCTMHASNQLGSQGAGTANPFVAGTTWSIITDPAFDGSTPWAAAGKYSVTANSDGSATLAVASPLTAGVDYVQLRATAPSAAISDSRYPIVVT